MNNNKKIPNVPNLRFPEFTGEWKTCAFSDIGTFSKGVGISKEQLTEDGTPCILYGELYTKYKNEVIREVISKTSIDTKGLVFSRANDVIIPSSGETAIDIATACCVTLDNVLLGGDLNIIRPHKHNGTFISYQLNGKRKYDIAKVAQGIAIIHLYNESLKKIKISTPADINEEKKIVALLSLLDERISTQSQIIRELESLILGIANSLFGDTRYGFEKSTLSMLCQVRKGEQINGLKLSANGDYYVMNGGIVPSGYHTEYNSEADTISISEGGNSCGYVQYNLSKFWSGGHCYTLNSVNAKVSNKYLYYYLKNQERKIMELRVGSGLPNIQKKELDRFEVSYPSPEKQLGIVRVLNTLSDKIETERKLLSEYQKQKKYLLNQMFI